MKRKTSNLSGIKKSLSVIVLMCGIYVLVAFVLYLLLMVQASHKEKGDVSLLNKSDKLWWDVEVFVVIYCLPHCNYSVVTECILHQSMRRKLCSRFFW